MDLVNVRFVETWSPYAAGERAGFPAAQAAWLVAQGLAVYAAGAAPASAPPAPAPAPVADKAVRGPRRPRGRE